MGVLKDVFEFFKGMFRMNDRLDSLSSASSLHANQILELTERVTRLEVQVDMVLRLLMRRLE